MRLRRQAEPTIVLSMHVSFRKAHPWRVTASLVDSNSEPGEVSRKGKSRVVTPEES